MSNQFNQAVGGGFAAGTLTPISAMGTIGGTDDSSTFQSAATTGGDYWVPAGTYRVNNVAVTGGVRYWCETGTVFKAPTAVVGTLPTFTIDGGGSRAADWGFLGSFTIDYSDRSASEKRKGIYVRNATRWRIGQARMIHGASSSAVSGASAGGVLLALAENQGADSIINGVVEYLESVNAPYGYGPTQFSGGVAHCRFGTIISDAGVPFRLETDGGASFPNQAQDVHDIYVDQVVLNAPASGGYGNSGVLIANHGANVTDVTIGRVDVRNARWGVAISDNTGLSSAQITAGGTGGGGVISHFAIKSGRAHACGDGIRRTSTGTDFATTHPFAIYDFVATSSSTGTYNIDGGSTAAGGGRGIEVINAMQLYNCKAKDCAAYGMTDTLQAGVNFTHVARLFGCRIHNCQTGAGGTAAASTWNNLSRLEIDGLEVIDDRGTAKHSFAVTANGSPYVTAIYASNLVVAGSPVSSISGGASLNYTDASNVTLPLARQVLSGRWAQPPSATLSTAALTTLSQIIAVPFDVEVTQNFTAMAVEITTAASAGGVARLGVYTNSGGGPGTLFASLDSGDLATTSTGLITYTFGSSTSFPIARYWLAMVARVALPTLRSLNSNIPYVPLATSAPTSASVFNCVTETGSTTTGALPGSWPSGVVGGGGGPRIMIKAA